VCIVCVSVACVSLCVEYILFPCGVCMCLFSLCVWFMYCVLLCVNGVYVFVFVVCV